MLIALASCLVIICVHLRRCFLPEQCSVLSQTVIELLKYQLKLLLLLLGHQIFLRILDVLRLTYLAYGRFCLQIEAGEMMALFRASVVGSPHVMQRFD